MKNSESSSSALGCINHKSCDLASFWEQEAYFWQQKYESLRDEQSQIIEQELKKQQQVVTNRLKNLLANLRSEQKKSTLEEPST